MTNDDQPVADSHRDEAAPLDDLTREDFDELMSLLGDEAVWSEPSAELEDAIVAAIGHERLTVGTRVAEPLTARRDSLRASGRTAPRAWKGGRVLLAAAAAVAAITVGLVIDRAGDDGDDRETLHVAFDDDGGTATLTKFDSGWQIVLEAERLPRRDGGAFYEAWLRNEAGVLVSIGTFNEGDEVVLWAGVSPRDYPTITVTREIADGDPASSGDRALVGVIDEG